MSVIRDQRLPAAAATRGKLEFLPPTMGVVLPPVASPARELQQRLEREFGEARGNNRDQPHELSYFRPFAKSFHSAVGWHI